MPSTLARPVERPLARLLWTTLQRDEPHRFQLVLGPRRVGKTTALYQTVRHLVDSEVDPRRIRWLRLGHSLLLQENLGDLVHTVVTTARASADQPSVRLDRGYLEGQSDQLAIWSLGRQRYVAQHVCDL